MQQWVMQPIAIWMARKTHKKLPSSIPPSTEDDVEKDNHAYRLTDRLL
ncbi:hypothetical protein [Enterovibrio norvegicus]|nr:hypothetical protein [Enterovibrio norvegicus]